MRAQTVHASEAEIEAWKRAAGLADRSFNGWVRMALNQRAELERALERERVRREARPEL